MVLDGCSTSQAAPFVPIRKKAVEHVGGVPVFADVTSALLPVRSR